MFSHSRSARGDIAHGFSTFEYFDDTTDTTTGTAGGDGSPRRDAEDRAGVGCLRLPQKGHLYSVSAPTWLLACGDPGMSTGVEWKSVAGFQGLSENNACRTRSEDSTAAAVANWEPAFGQIGAFGTGQGRKSINPLWQQVRSISEHQLRPKLNIPVPGCAGDIAKRRSSKRSRRIAKIRVVEQRERLEAELEFQTLTNRKALEQGEIHGLGAGTMQQVAAFIPISVVGRRGGKQIRNRICAGIDASHQMSASATIARHMH